MAELIAMDYTFAPDFQLIVHCRQGAEWTSQAPSGPVGRLARHHRTLVVPSPKFHHEESRPYFTLSPAPEFGDVMFMQTHFPAAMLEEGALVDAECTKMLEKALIGPLIGEFPCAVQWFQDPMAAEAHAGRHQVAAVVYDCRDGMVDAAILPRAAARERRILSMCDLVLARDETDAAYFRNAGTPCQIAGEEFSPAESHAPSLPGDLENLTGPLLGYFGVIDERIDLNLVAELAEANPNWHIVMVGPVSLPDPGRLPEFPNLHWLGGRPSGEIPAFASAFQICILPFAQGHSSTAVRASHRLTALEFFAGGTPVVATQGARFGREFAGAIHVVETSDFVQECREQVTAPGSGAIERGHEYARVHSAQAAGQEIEACLTHVVAKREGIGATAAGADRIFDIIVNSNWV